MIRHFICGLGAATLALSSPLQAAEIEIEAEGPVVELSVYESVTAEPDIVTIGAGVSTEAPTAVAALRENSVQMRAVINQIKALGVADEDIQTTGINLNAQYDYDRTNRRQVFRAYQVSNRVSVKLRDIEETGEALDALVSAGATDLSGPTFGLDDDAKAKDEARKRAIERAGERAMAYAAMLGYEEARVLEINETITGRGSVQRSALRAPVAEVAADATAPVQPGQVSTGVSITINYELVGGDEAAID
ncbi:MAG: SIMPL domain-containing protein [Pseudomonadota bacterium]